MGYRIKYQDLCLLIWFSITFIAISNNYYCINSRFGCLNAFRLVIIQVYKNISSFTHRLHSNIGKIICKNVNNIFHIQNFGNFKTDFFLNLYLQIFLVKQVSSKNCSFYGLPLWHLHWISGLYSASNSHNFCIVV